MNIVIRNSSRWVWLYNNICFIFTDMPNLVFFFPMRIRVCFANPLVTSVCAECGGGVSHQSCVSYSTVHYHTGHIPLSRVFCVLIHLGRDKMAAISQTTISKAFSWMKNIWILIKISLKFVPGGPIDNKPTIVQIMAWRRPGDNPLYESMLVSLLTLICVLRPQWVNACGSWSWREVHFLVTFVNFVLQPLLTQKRTLII